MTFSLDFHARSDVGRIRKDNQDAGYASPNLLVVADGMGGAAAGDLASAVAIDETSRHDERLPQPELLDHMEQVITRANEKLSELVAADPTLDGMGTTYCGAAFSGTTLGLAHIGDSRCYLLRHGELSQLTHDHSWVQSLIDEGRLTPEQAATHPHRSLILKVLNGHASMTPDFITITAQLGDRFLFCSDGLSGMIDDDHIAELLSHENLARSVDEMIEAANRAGGHDNITAIVAEVVPQDDALDAAPVLMVGSAVERVIPDVEELAEEFQQSVEPLIGLDEEDEPEEDDDSERARYALDPTPRKRWPGVIGGILAVALVIGGAVWGVVAYANSRYFIADTDGYVGIYNGLPGSLLGRELNTLVEVSDVAVSDLPRFHQRLVGNTIGLGSITEARETSERLRGLAERCVAVREEHQNPPTPTVSPTPTPTPSGLSTGMPNYPTYLAPVTPTSSEEADPEDC